MVCWYQWHVSRGKPRSERWRRGRQLQLQTQRKFKTAYHSDRCILFYVLGIAANWRRKWSDIWYGLCEDKEWQIFTSISETVPNWVQHAPHIMPWADELDYAMTSIYSSQLYSPWFCPLNNLLFRFEVHPHPITQLQKVIMVVTVPYN